jgi:hypothetical protein
MIRKKEANREIIIDLTGPDGNAFALLAYADRFARWLGMDPKPVLDEMRTGDYENLLQVFDYHFGQFVVLER